MTDKNNKTKFGAFGVSIFIHGAILLAIATMTIQLTMPEGNVSDAIEFNAIVPEGTQLSTPNVAPQAQPESPEKVKRQDAPPPPPAPSEKVPEISEESVKPVVPVEDGSLDVVQDKPEYAQPEPVAEPEKAPEPVAEELPQAKEPDEEAPRPPAPVVGAHAEETKTVGNDAADLKGQEKVEDQNFGAAQGVRNADQFLRAVPGNKQPEYPWMARLRRIEGQVLVHFDVSERGEVSNIQIIQSTNEMFNDNVLKAMKTWKFIPPVEPGVYAKPWTFQLKGDSKEKPTLLRRKSN